MVRKILMTCLIVATIGCDKPKLYKAQDTDDSAPKKIPVVIVNDSDEEEVIEETEAPSPPPSTPSETPNTDPTTPSETPVVPDVQCCKICKSSTPCGDACIASTKTCSKPAGCACKADGTRP